MVVMYVVCVQIGTLLLLPQIPIQVQGLQSSLISIIFAYDWSSSMEVSVLSACITAMKKVNILESKLGFERFQLHLMNPFSLPLYSYAARSRGLSLRFLHFSLKILAEGEWMSWIGEGCAGVFRDRSRNRNVLRIMDVVHTSRKCRYWD